MPLLREVKPCCAFALAASAAVLVACGAAEQPGVTRVREAERQISSLEERERVLQRRLSWFEAMHAARLRDAVDVIHALDGAADGSPDGKGGAAYLKQFALSVPQTEGGMRDFIARLFSAAWDHRSAFSERDEEVSLLVKMGPGCVPVLLELLESVPLHGAETYALTALKALATDRDRDGILERLPNQHSLIDVVVEKGWVAAAKPVLLSKLAERTRYLPAAWTVAAAEIAGPGNYDDLLYQIQVAANPVPIWTAVRALPGLEPLDAWAGRLWAGTSWPSGSFSWRQVALIAAHYGHVEALDALVAGLGHREEEAWLAFQRLTGFGVGRRDAKRESDAQAWFAANRKSLAFDRGQGRYVAK